MSLSPTSNRFDIRKHFARGESLVAATGMAFIAILALAIGAVVWISAKTVDVSATIQANNQSTQTSELIASQAELRLSDNDLAGLRRLMLDAVASGLVESCEVQIPDFGVLASSNPSQSSLNELPETWIVAPELPAVLEYSEATGKTTVRDSLVVNGQSGIVLEVVTTRGKDAVGSDTIRASSVGITSVGLVLVLLVYRRFRNRLGALSAIGDSLRSAAEGERRVACLIVGEHLGPEGKTWNTLLEERENFENVMYEHEVADASTTGRIESVGLPAACNTLMQGVVLIESDLTVVYANGAASNFLRMDREEMVGQKLDQVSEANLIMDLTCSVLDVQGPKRQVIEVGDVENIETHGAVLRFVITRIDEAEVPQALVFIEDVTQQRLADQSQGAFIAQATHELRTPLTTIRLYAEEAVEAGSEDELIREKALNVINSETRRLERIVGDMLCVSEIEAGSLSIHPDQVRTEQMFQSLEHDYAAQAKDKSIEMSFDLPPKFPTIQADRDRLGQALHNLVGNAIKYTPSGGKVEVKVSFSDTNSMRVDVIDSGIGIEESQQERIFDRFCRADDRRIAQVTGSGLGLALARQIARLHGGDVTVESAIDKGSTFTLILPGSSEELAKAA
ncbi:MAG: PAS domain-containing sensor histidine kinase [Phycisphaerales bacterium]|nr:PAS domain-containing sensor histidine kinase [Phycisphaerales bacterium]